jgi:hypothetical protein
MMCPSNCGQIRHQVEGSVEGRDHNLRIASCCCHYLYRPFRIGILSVGTFLVFSKDSILHMRVTTISINSMITVVMFISRNFIVAMVLEEDNSER